MIVKPTDNTRITRHSREGGDPDRVISIGGNGRKSRRSGRAQRNPTMMGLGASARNKKNQV